MKVTFFLIDSILEERNMGGRETLLSLSDGRIYSSLQAQENGLIDKIGGVLDDALDEAEALAEIENATVIRYKKIDPTPIRLLLEGGLQYPILKLRNSGTGMDLIK